MADDPDKRAGTQRTETIAPQPQPDGEEARVRRITKAVHYLSERHGFAPGCEVEDWLAAEAQINTTPPAQR